MKKYILLWGLLILLLLIAGRSMSQVTNPGTVVQQNGTNHANNDVNNSVNNGLNNAESSLKGLFKKKKKMSHADSVKMGQTQAAATAPGSTTAATASNPPAGQGATQTLTSYQNYDFVPGNNILFEDEFTDDQSGEFPTH